MVDVSGYPRSLANASGYLILVEFSRILTLVEFSRFFRCRVDISGNLRLVDLSGFSRFRFRVRAVYYKAFLLITKGSK